MDKNAQVTLAADMPATFKQCTNFVVGHAEALRLLSDCSEIVPAIALRLPTVTSCSIKRLPISEKSAYFRRNRPTFGESAYFRRRCRLLSRYGNERVTATEQDTQAAAPVLERSRQVLDGFNVLAIHFHNDVARL